MESGICKPPVTKSILFSIRKYKKHTFFLQLNVCSLTHSLRIALFWNNWKSQLSFQFPGHMLNTNVKISTSAHLPRASVFTLMFFFNKIVTWPCCYKWIRYITRVSLTNYSQKYFYDEIGGRSHFCFRKISWRHSQAVYIIGSNQPLSLLRWFKPAELQMKWLGLCHVRSNIRRAPHVHASGQ